MEDLFKLIELVGGTLASIITILVFFKIVIFPFFVRLEVQLTKDLFFRLTDLGEIFFPRVIVYAPINIQIIDCIFELKGKKDTQETSYICKAEQFGSVERNSINEHSVSSFYLPKSSPEFLLKAGESKELLIQCSIIESTEKIKKSIGALLNDYILQQSAPTEQNKKLFFENFKKYSANILSSVKIESGDHTLVCKIRYKYRHSFITRRRSAESKVKINITENALNMYKNQQSIENLLFDYLSILNPKNRNIKVRYPECGIN
ncbi:MAG: hypothetical protein OXN83_03045 [Oligoflexia bacterium]|nr:hypothetical protein [Oligoflexia bacterium]